MCVRGLHTAVENKDAAIYRTFFWSLKNSAYVKGCYSNKIFFNICS